MRRRFRWGRFIDWLDNEFNHDDVTFEPRFRALCDYNDYLITRRLRNV